MRSMIGLLIACLLAAVAGAAAVDDTSYIAPDGSRVIRHEVDLPVSTDEVYRALTTAEGWRTWAVPFATLSRPLGVGTDIETSYNPVAVVGDKNNIKNRVLAYVPRQMLAFQVVQAPEGFKHIELMQHIFTVAQIEQRPRGRSHLSLSMLGYGQGQGFDELHAFFLKGNAWTLERLKQRFELGPIDWKKELAPKQQD